MGRSLLGFRFQGSGLVEGMGSADYADDRRLVGGGDDETGRSLLRAEGDFEAVVALGGAGRGLVALLSEAVDWGGFRDWRGEVGPGCEVDGGLDGLDQVVGGKVARDEDVVERGSEGLALECVGDKRGGVAAREGGAVGGAGVSAGGGGGPPAGGEVGTELGGGTDADEAEALAIGGFGPGVGVGVGEAFDDGSGGVVEGDGLA
jgi:hypothetical protein